MPTGGPGDDSNDGRPFEPSLIDEEVRNAVLFRRPGARPENEGETPIKVFVAAGPSGQARDELIRQLVSHGV
jgi:hypothetical protein